MAAAVACSIFLVLPFAILSQTATAYAVSCPDYGAIENGSSNLIDVGVPTNTQALHIECDPGFDLTGRPKVLCIDGSWEHIPRPKCSKRCSPPPFMLNAEIVIDGRNDDGNRYYKASTATYHCGPGFTLYPVSSKYRVCKDGAWTGTQGNCVSDGCDTPPDISSGYFVMKSSDDFEISSDNNKVSVGQRAHYNCRLGYKLVGPEVLQCVETGGWSPRKPPQCELIEPHKEHDGWCSPPIVLSPGSVVTTTQGTEPMGKVPPGTELLVQCAVGYRDAIAPCKTMTITCNAASWQGMLPDCVPVSSCRPPPGIEHGTLFGLPLEGKYQVNAQVAYSCQPGYALNGHNLFTCKPNGCWLPDALPKCVEDTDYYAGLGSPRHQWGYVSTDSTIIISLATALGAMLILVSMGGCLLLVCRRHHRLDLHRSSHHRQRRPSNGGPQTPEGNGVANAGSLLHDPDRVALIAFADGVTLGEALLPTYEEAIREQRGNILTNANLLGCRTLRPYWGPPPRRPRGPGSIPGDAHVTRQSSSASHSASLRSGGDSMGSTDTMTASDTVSTNVTLDTVSSHTCSSGSQSASCRAIFGSLASFDTSSVHNTDGVPLLEENEFEDGVRVSTPGHSLSVDQESDNGSFKYRRTSPELSASSPRFYYFARDRPSEDRA